VIIPKKTFNFFLNDVPCLMEELFMLRVVKSCRVKPISLQKWHYLKIVTRILGL